MKTAATANGTSSAISDSEMQAYLDKGYLICKDVLTQTELTRLADDCVRWGRGCHGTISEQLEPAPELSEYDALARILAIHHPQSRSDCIRAMIRHEHIVDRLQQLVGAHIPAGWWDGSVKSVQSMLFCKAPGMPGQGWHQDEHPIPTRDRSLTAAWIAIDDATIDNGCLWVLPGSHRSGIIYDRHKQDRTSDASNDYDSRPIASGFDESGQIPVELTAGSVLFFNGHLLHRSGPNRSQRFRRALVNHYMTAQSRLPWTHAKDPEQPELMVPVGSCDNRRVELVSGTDPYAEKGYRPVPQPSLRKP